MNTHTVHLNLANAVRSEGKANDRQKLKTRERSLLDKKSAASSEQLEACVLKDLKVAVKCINISKGYYFGAFSFSDLTQQNSINADRSSSILLGYTFK